MAIPWSTVYPHLAEKLDYEKVLETALGKEGGISRFVETANAIGQMSHWKAPPHPGQPLAEDTAGKNRENHGGNLSSSFHICS